MACAPRRRVARRGVAGLWLESEPRTGGRRRPRQVGPTCQRQRRVGARAGPGRGEKKIGELPCYLTKLWGSELVEEKARGRRQNGDDSREGRHHDEEDDELGTRVVSDFTGDDGCGGWWDSGEKIILGIPKQGAFLWVVYIFCVELS